MKVKRSSVVLFLVIILATVIIVGITAITSYFSIDNSYNQNINNIQNQAYSEILAEAQKEQENYSPSLASLRKYCRYEQIDDNSVNIIPLGSNEGLSKTDIIPNTILNIDCIERQAINCNYSFNSEICRQFISCTLNTQEYAGRMSTADIKNDLMYGIILGLDENFYGVKIDNIQYNIYSPDGIMTQSNDIVVNLSDGSVLNWNIETDETYINGERKDIFNEETLTVAGNIAMLAEQN